MKKLLCLVVLLVCVSGCANPPIYMMKDFHQKEITRCDNDMFCFREVYDVAWDNSCSSECNKYVFPCGTGYHEHVSGFPVSYRTRTQIHVNDPHGYAVTLPAGGNTAFQRDGGTKEENK